MRALGSEVLELYGAVRRTGSAVTCYQYALNAAGRWAFRMRRGAAGRWGRWRPARAAQDAAELAGRGYARVGVPAGRRGPAGGPGPDVARWAERLAAWRADWRSSPELARSLAGGLDQLRRAAGAAESATERRSPREIREGEGSVGGRQDR